MSENPKEVSRPFETLELLAATNAMGDKFQLAAVIFAISLFFGGIVQVFRNNMMRWVILGGGGLLFLAATIYMLRLPWTS